MKYKTLTQTDLLKISTYTYRVNANKILIFTLALPQSQIWFNRQAIQLMRASAEQEITSSIWDAIYKNHATVQANHRQHTLRSNAK